MPKRSFALLLTLTAPACLSHSYAIQRGELERLASTPAESRGSAVRATQELGWDAEDRPAETTADDGLVIMVAATAIAPDESAPPPEHRRATTRHRRNSGSNAASSDDDSSSSAAIAAIVVIVGSVVVGAVAAGTEGARFDGTLQLPPTQPLHLFDAGGAYAGWVPLSELRIEHLDGVTLGVVDQNEGNVVELEQADMNRVGFALDVALGPSAHRPSDDHIAFAGRIGFGYFPIHELGVLATLESSWVLREDTARFTPGLEVQALPLALGPFSLGAFVGLGQEFTLAPDGDSDTTVLSGGLLSEIEVRTRLALTLRAAASTSLSRGNDVSLGLQLGVAVY